MAQKLITDVSLDLLYDSYKLLGTKLPYPWDFVRIHLRWKERLVLNAGSYFATYLLFIAGFMRYMLREIGALSENGPREKHWYLTCVLSLATSTQVLWPLLLVSTHFASCSYYPWLTTLVVLYLNCPPFPWHLISEAIHSSADFLDSQLRVALDGIEAAVGESFDSEDDSNEQSPENDSLRTNDSNGPMVKSTEASEAMADETVRMDSRTRVAEIDASRPTDGQQQLGRDVSLRTRMKVEVKEERGRVSFVSTETGGREAELGKGGLSRSVSEGKKGYCGRCFRYAKLPFAAGCSSLRAYFTTRTGRVYGPTSHVIKRDKYIDEYGL